MGFMWTNVDTKLKWTNLPKYSFFLYWLEWIMQMHPYPYGSLYFQNKLYWLDMIKQICSIFFLFKFYLLRVNSKILLVKWERTHEYQIKGIRFFLFWPWTIAFCSMLACGSSRLLQALQKCQKGFSGMTPCLQHNQLAGTTSMCGADTQQKIITK